MYRALRVVKPVGEGVFVCVCVCVCGGGGGGGESTSNLKVLNHRE